MNIICQTIKVLFLTTQIPNLISSEIEEEIGLGFLTEGGKFKDILIN